MARVGAKRVEVARKAKGKVGEASVNPITFLRECDKLNEMERIENHADSIKVSENHPYWRGGSEVERRLAIMEGMIELFRALLVEPERGRRGKR